MSDPKNKWNQPAAPPPPMFFGKKERDLVKQVKPHVLIVGSDWKDKAIVGEEHAQHIRFFDRIDGYSTTEILEWKNQ